ncbi:hypothetical protein EVAR_68812_1 [Eumeta japonica]|uniref:Uncharacterized protein n=1 Tax=Eumeta variegata TaxID=151549 RepID=A0A4C1YX11_EUMVA|nr:hypothetical protein EVAR_68812_1 [Eumeta japonica]
MLEQEEKVAMLLKQFGNVCYRDLCTRVYALSDGGSAVVCIALESGARGVLTTVDINAMTKSRTEGLTCSPKHRPRGLNSTQVESLLVNLPVALELVNFLFRVTQLFIVHSAITASLLLMIRFQPIAIVRRADKGRPRKPYEDRMGGELKEGKEDQLLGTRNRRARMKRLMDDSEEREVCDDRYRMKIYGICSPFWEIAINAYVELNRPLRASEIKLSHRSRTLRHPTRTKPAQRTKAPHLEKKRLCEGRPQRWVNKS